MRTARISIDCDQVLRDFTGKIMELCEENGNPIPRPKSWDFIDDITINGETLRHKIWKTEEWLEDVFLGAKVLPFARKGYEAFIEDPKFEVHIVTSQYKETEWLTSQWLKSNGFDRHEKTHFLFDKLQSPTQIIIDDKPSHIEDFQQNGREGYLVSASHNLDAGLHPRVENLYDAYEQISERYKEVV